MEKAVPPPLLYFKIFVQLNLPDLSSAFRVCKSWAYPSRLELFWKEYICIHYPAIPLPAPHDPIYHKPPNESWRWVALSRKRIQAVDKFTGIGWYEHYQGEWVDGKPEGRGVQRSEPPLMVYMGDFKAGNKHGFGQLYFNTGAVYEGQWKNGKKNGKGKLTWTSGASYTGDYLEDRRTGKGTYVWPNGDKYEGHSLDDKRNGTGRYEWDSGDKYDGEYSNDMQHGKGVYYWKNGNMYSGEYAHDKRNGFGVFQEKNGHQVAGFWGDGLPLEKGVFNISSTIARLHPRVRSAIENRVCTYFYTGKKRHGQLFFEVREMDERPHGVCLVCVDMCVPKNGIALLNQRPLFGGNFYCDCGAGTDRPGCCLARGDALVMKNREIEK
eukprot:TRINITY_DN2884_c0_g1_i1.p1 TRINITY_DN2884_c0_g1~~TRINITY_DN2884_c0_g1_i1.p1  ORF type:complete len:381 (-),score=47.64 TRINITY_DN2884_c0_g1_i1:200-1342(-)